MLLDCKNMSKDAKIKQREKEKSRESLENFKKEFKELRARYPDIMVYESVHGDLSAMDTANCKEIVALN